MPIPIFFDSHAHLDGPRFSDDIAAVVERAAEAGITRIVTVGIDFESSRRAIHLSEQFPNVFAAVGWHPTDVLDAPEDLRPELRELIQHPKVVAIGETGLDYFHAPGAKSGGSEMGWEEYKNLQAKYFQQQLEVAAESRMNIVVHHRKSLDDCLKLMAPFASRVRGQFHCFEDDAAAVERVLAIGSLVSFTGILTFKNKQVIRDALAATPMGQFMLETDSPYLVPEPNRGKIKRCEPAFVKDTAAVAAEVKGCSLEELSDATCRTAREFFPKLT